MVEAPGTDNLVGTIVVPVENAAEAQRIADSVTLDRSGGGATLSFTRGGTAHTYTYKMTGDGLVLAK